MAGEGWTGREAPLKHPPMSRVFVRRSCFDGPLKFLLKSIPLDLASNLDLVPTILNACGIGPDERMSGIRSFKSQGSQKRKSIFLENFTHDMLDVDRPETALRARSIVQHNWKLTRWTEPHPELKSMGWQIGIPREKVELFDLTKDPLESTNLADQNPDLVQNLTVKLNAQVESTAE